MNPIVITIIVLGVVGLVIGIVLGVAGKKLAVEVDERVVEIREVLPGNNCGACGYPGCDGLSAAIASGKAPVNACPVGGAAVAAKVGKIMGVDAEGREKQVAYVKCNGSCDKTKTYYEYAGVESCKMMPFVPGGGPKSCDFGCFGFGDCAAACQFDAINVVNGVAIVDKEKCTSCGACIKACPQHLIELVPYEKRKKFHVTCSNRLRGKPVIQACDVGCIGCGMCEKNCPKDAVHVEGNLAKIDYEKCVGCSKCYQVCPRHSILSWEPLPPAQQRADEKESAS